MLRADRIQSDVLRLEGPATLDQADTLHTALAALLPEPNRVTVDLSGVHDLDTAGLQVLLAFAAARGDQGVVFTGWSELARQRIALAGLTRLLD